MITTRSFALLLPLVLVACGGATASVSESDPTKTVGDPSQAPAPTVSPKDPSTSTTPPAPPFTTNPASTVDFHASLTSARRQPSANASCGKNDAPFSDDDLFVLQVVGSSSSPNVKIRSVVATFKRTTTLSIALPLEVDAPTAYGQQKAHSETAGITLFGSDATDAPLSTPIDGASLTVLDVAQADGAPLTARVQLHFENGETLDATISAKLESYEGPCAGGKGD